MAGWDEIKQLVERNGNVKTFTMEELRNAHGVERLGVNVRAEISDTLAGMGLGHVPVDLPGYQDKLVRVYKNGTPVGEWIKTMLEPGQQNDGKLTEKFSAGGVDHAAIVERIRELVAE